MAACLVIVGLQGCSGETAGDGLEDPIGTDTQQADGVLDNDQRPADDDGPINEPVDDTIDDPTPTDADGDGYPADWGDCDDENPNTYPGAEELPDKEDND